MAARLILHAMVLKTAAQGRRYPSRHQDVDVVKRLCKLGAYVGHVTKHIGRGWHSGHSAGICGQAIGCGAERYWSGRDQDGDAVVVGDYPSGGGDTAEAPCDDAATGCGPGHGVDEWVAAAGRGCAGSVC